MRFDGQAISLDEYERVSHLLTRARESVPPSDDGYLSPTGSFTITGAAWAAAQGARYSCWRRGSADDPTRSACSSLSSSRSRRCSTSTASCSGPTLDDVARDLLGVVGPSTRTIVTVVQDAEVTAIVEETAAKFGAELVTVTADSPTSAPADLAPITLLNATAGETAARALASALGWRVDDAGLPLRWRAFVSRVG